MPVIDIPLSTQDFSNRAKNPQNQLLTNMYSVPNAIGQDSPYTLRQRYSIDEVADVGQTISGLGIFNNIIYAVGTAKIKKYDLNGTFLGDAAAFVPSGAERYELLDNFSGQIGLLANNGTYAVLDSGVIYSPAFPSGTSKTFTDMNTYWVFNKEGTNQFFWCNSGDGRNFNSLNFDSAYEKSDNVVRVFSANNILYVFGKYTIEFFTSPLDGTVAFEKVQGTSNTTIGCGAKYSVVSLFDEVFFLGSDGVVYKIKGYNHEEISSSYISEVISRFSNFSDAVGYVFNEGNQYFYMLKFIGENLTFLYNIKTGEWHRRTSGALSYWEFDFVQQIDNRVYGAVGTKIYKLSRLAVDDEGENIARIFTTSFIHNNDLNIIHYALVLDISTGTVGSGDTEPTISMIYSDDDGRTYSTPRTIGIGSNAQYNKQIEFRGLGVSKKRFYRFSVSGKCEISVHSCKLRMEMASDR